MLSRKEIVGEDGEIVEIDTVFKDDFKF